MSNPKNKAMWLPLAPAAANRSSLSTHTVRPFTDTPLTLLAGSVVQSEEKVRDDWSKFIRNFRLLTAHPKIYDLSKV